ncbi:Ppx/GppA family phosphatase [Paenibacillus whitsoniae]|uniref:Chaperone protein DnaK n=1 Tax=Paenibacillus whitsoniae TaxID=2496558 RepID=A0A430JDU8_9BACL|nr:Ppx/GppA family phosphatase [Paenibacillus whitsoniae]RTE09242.1 Ppx/GppA family phosphatase [Paenibacillus whitsoniae]
MSTSSSQHIGIIDIGSNSIRLVLYEVNSFGAYRVVGEYKNSARLSERMGPDGLLPTKDILSIVPILAHYQRLCRLHGVGTIRVAATAAIRNSGNTADIVRLLQEHTGLHIEVLSGYEEARYGYLGVINAIDIRDCLIIDIGGGSTEVTLVQGRELIQSVSFPFGAVNTTRQFAKGDVLSEQASHNIRSMVVQAIAEHPWIRETPGLPMIGLGGTIRTLGKMSQRRKKHSLSLAHNYELRTGELREFLSLLSAMPLEKRKKIDGLSKDRADIMVPGLLIMDTIYEAAGASKVVISGSGLRDGLFYELFRPEQPVKPDVLEACLDNLLGLHPNAAVQHVRHVDRFAMQLYDALEATAGNGSSRDKELLHTAALMYRIGASVHYYQFLKHTQYVIQGVHLEGLSHREIVIASLLATFKTKSRTQQQALAHKDLLLESDLSLIVKLGILLKTAIALDISETQPVQELRVAKSGNLLTLHLVCTHDVGLELKELSNISKDLEKAWNHKLKIDVAASSRK